MMTRTKCDACDYEFLDPYAPQICFKCASTEEGLNYLKSHELSPRDVYENIRDRPGFQGISLNVAKSLVEIFRTKHEQPN